jgi:hypothetical protein
MKNGFSQVSLHICKASYKPTTSMTTPIISNFEKMGVKMFLSHLGISKGRRLAQGIKVGREYRRCLAKTKTNFRKSLIMCN